MNLKCTAYLDRPPFFIENTSSPKRVFILPENSRKQQNLSFKNIMFMNKDIILVAGTISRDVIENIREYIKSEGEKYKIAVIYSSKRALSSGQKKTLELVDIAIPANLDSTTGATEALLPYKDNLIAITCRIEAHIPEFQKIIPHVPYLKTPTVKSLDWATSKIDMRRRFRAYNKKITPKFAVVSDSTKTTLKVISKKVGFPLVIKPTGLAQSVLVNIVYHEEELEKELKKVFRKLSQAYKTLKRKSPPHVLVEQFMDGDMYSMDAFVTSRGKVYFCPPVAVKTGKAIGFDDFFGYQQMTPTLLSKDSIEVAQGICIDAIHAIALRSTSVHIELMKTEKGWKVVELGPRLGGFRQTLYKLAYNIDVTACDIKIRIPKKFNITKTPIGNAVAMKFFAKKEGVIKSIVGVKKAQDLKSLYDISVNKKVGDRATFAKNGGKSVFNIIMHNKDRSKLLADVRRLEQMVKIEVESRSK